LRHGHRVILYLRENAPVRTANRLIVLDTDGGVDSFGITICCERENPGRLSAPVAAERSASPKKGNSQYADENSGSDPAKSGCLCWFLTKSVAPQSLHLANTRNSDDVSPESQKTEVFEMEER
jgi:hypothetical protein